MRRNLLTLFAVLFGMVSTAIAQSPAISSAQTQLPAFPGAEGFGMYTLGARNASNIQVRHVTNLQDNAAGESVVEGSLRWACQSNTIVVFDVSGTIFLKQDLPLKNRSNLTILGQTAPGDGICVADYPVTLGNQQIVRFMRFRLGNRNVAHHEGDGLGSMDKNNIIVDHCSVSWSIDECISVYGGRNITVQWTIGAQSLVNAGHSKGAHGYGGNWGGSGCTYHHNLLAHHTSRVPRLGPRPGTQMDERLDLRNNVFYNWAGEGCYGGEGMNVNIVNNYYKVGPATLTRNTARQQRIASVGIRTSSYTKHDTSKPNNWDKMWHVWGDFYVRGNVNSKYDEVTKDNWTYGMYNQITNSKVDDTFTQATKDTMRINTPINYLSVTTETAYDAYEKVLNYAGASLHRDALDSLVVADTRNGKATYTGSGLASGFINTQNDLKPAGADSTWSPWPALAHAAAPTDTDGDGMPDAWETANGTDPNVDDASVIAANGYTNIENYANSLVSDIMTAENEGGTLLQGQQEAETGIDGEVTAIHGVTVSNASMRLADNNLYSANGILLGTNVSSDCLQSLPRGLYIYNHKVITVK